MENKNFRTDVVKEQDEKAFFYEINTKKELLKRTLAKNLTDDELELFAQICRQTQLDPFIKQIYPIKRRNKNSDGTYTEVMTPQVGIDGLRSIAERTGNYSPGKETSFQYADDKTLFSATAYVKKMTPDGTWHEISSTAILREYKPSGNFNTFWNDKPHIMLSKCAEALAIRKAFPALTANLYTPEEMGGENISVEEIKRPSLNGEQLLLLTEQLKDDPQLEYRIVQSYNKINPNIRSLKDLPATEFEKIISNLEKRKMAEVG